MIRRAHPPANADASHGRLSHGQSMVEYTLLLATFAIVAVVAYTTMGFDLKALASWPLIERFLTGS